MDDLYYQTYSALYFSQDVPINPNITIADLVLSFFIAVVMLTTMTLLLDKWTKEAIEEMKKEWRSL
jgi:hypothetical protein